MPGNGRKVAQEDLTDSGVENVRMTGDGVYQINLESLLKGTPLVMRIREGIYRIDPSPFPKVS
jgi:predicted  nucleic acid-binding Zn-ribbon protein